MASCPPTVVDDALVVFSWHRVEADEGTSSIAAFMFYCFFISVSSM